MAKINQEGGQHEELISKADKRIREYIKYLVKLSDYRDKLIESQLLGTTPPKPPKNPPGV
jgi:hypothetical protein